MHSLIATVMLAAVTSGTALAQPAGTTELPPTAPAASEPPASIEPPLAAPALTRPLSLTRAPTVTRWYGWQVLAADAGTFGFAYAIDNGYAALGWVASGPLLHAAHGNLGRSAASLGFRLVLPVLGAMALGSSAHGCARDELCGLGEVVAGVLIGATVAEVIDLGMATDEHEVTPPKPSQRWAPVASLRPSSATFGIAARF